MGNEVKSLSRIYFPGTIHAHGECTLPLHSAHHVTRVLRLAAGERVVLFNGGGGEYTAVIAAARKDRVTLRVESWEEVERESPLAVHLAQAISSGERMDYTLQKAVELGVASIRPLTSNRSVVRLDAERARRRVAHWQSVVIAACEQCGRNRIPEVLPVMSLSNWLVSVAGAEYPCAGVAPEARSPAPVAANLRLLMSPQAQMRLQNFSRPAGAVTLLAGPEGGFTPEERRDARAMGFTAVRFGPRVLRTETAALAALAALQTLWGDF